MAIPAAPVEPSGDEVRIRMLVALLLRLGLGLILLNSGLLTYLRMRPGAAVVGHSYALPYLQISLGLALLLGIYTTTAALFAGILVLVPPLMQTITLLSGGFPPFARGPNAAQVLLESGIASNLLLVTAVLWFSGPNRNPWSLDGLIFAQRQEPRAVPSRAEAAETRVAEFISTCAESPDPGSTA